MAVTELRVDVFGLLSTLIVILVTAILKFVLKLDEECKIPIIYCNAEGKINKNVLERCKKFKEAFNPTNLWGKSGHIQTIIHAAIGRAGHQKLPKSKLYSLHASDGATVTYNFFSKDLNHINTNSKKENIVLIVPGIANSSKTVYIQATTALLLENGFDVAVFNHLGAHPMVKLTSPRLFTYGCTTDLHLVVKDVRERYPRRMLIGLGFSMGGNVLLKYLGEQPTRQKFFSFALSICQGYDVTRASSLLMQWKGLRRFYNWMISRNVKSLITRKHRKSFLEFERKGSFEKLDWRKISSASSLQELDDTVLRRFASFDDVGEFYRWCSSANYMHKIEIPTLLLNALDDPLVPDTLFDSPKKLVDENSEVIFVVTKHGGHLGFFQGGVLCPSETTWLDEALMEYILNMSDAMQSLQADDYVDKRELLSEGKYFSI